MAPPIVLPRDGVYGCRVSSVSDHPEVGGNGLSRPGWEFRVWTVVARALVTGGLPKILHARPTPAALARFANYSLPPTQSILFSGLGFFLRKPSCGPVTISPPPPAGAQAPQKPRARARARARARTGRVERVSSGRKGRGMHVYMYVCLCACMHVYVKVCMYVCTYVCMYVCMYVCLCFACDKNRRL